MAKTTFSGPVLEGKEGVNTGPGKSEQVQVTLY